MDPRGNQHQLFCFAVSLDGLVIIPHLSGKCNPFFEIFSKKFLKGESGGENLPLPSDPGAGRPASPVVETPRPNRRVRVLPAAGEKTSRFPRAQARAAQPARLLKLRAQTGACASCPPQAKKQPPYWATAFSVGENLFFRAVTSQVSSAPASLTSVFGMGTGGPSRQSTPTVLFCRISRRLNNNTTAFFKLQALFSKKFKNLLKHKI